MRIHNLISSCALLASFFLPTSACAELTQYGSIYYTDEVPHTGFLLGEIKDNDSFELRRLIRDHEVNLIVAGSPGGSLYEGLQIASIIHDNGFDTYVPAKWSCESSCANIFLGGHARLLTGDLGVHQFYTANGDSQQSTVGAATERTLYTTSDIIGVLDEFDTPAFVYEKMFRTTDIYYFNESEKRRLNKESTSASFFDQIDVVDTYIAAHSVEMLRLRFDTPTSNERTLAAPAPAPQAPTRQPATPGRSTDTYPNTDFFGSDISQTGHRYVSIQECDRICRSNPNCAAWSYVHASQWCWPKSAVTNMSLADGVTSSIVNYSRVDQSIFDRPFLEATGVDLRGYDIFPQGLRNTSLSQCRTICERNTSCHGFSWVARENWCFPKYQVGPTVDSLGVISGIWTEK